MVNIEDIRKRLERNPEPPVVTEARQRIKDAFGDIVFNEEEHRYFLPKPDGTMKELTAVSNVVEKFVPYVDWDAKAEIKAEKLGIPAEQLKREWYENNHLATTSGSVVHEYGEMWHHMLLGHPEDISDRFKIQYEGGYLFPASPKQMAAMKFNEYVFGKENIYTVEAEARVYCEELGYSGTFDRLLYVENRKDPSKSGFSLVDYKGLPLDTPIATKEGWKNMGEIEIGDEVFDCDGNLTKVTGVSSVHHNPCLKITFDNADSVICDEDHRWLVTFTGYKTKEKVMTAKELKTYMTGMSKPFDGTKIPKIKIVKPINMPKKDLPIDPYLLGVWLGDGNSVDGKITNMYDELWEEIKRRGYTVGKDVSGGGAGKATIRTIGGLTHELRLLGLIKNKHIPPMYLRASYEQRWDILRGIMDTDGYYHKTRRRFVITTTKLNSAIAYVQLLSSLGIKASLIKTWAVCGNCVNKEKRKAYNVTFNTTNNPFLIRKINIDTKNTARSRVRSIKKIEVVDTIPTKCIEVDSPSHTYCCGYNMLVTHNTNKDLTGSYARSFGQRMLPPFDEYIDEALSHYYVQFSMYQICLENIGLKVIDRCLVWLRADGEYELIRTPDLTKVLRETLKSMQP